MPVCLPMETVLKFSILILKLPSKMEFTLFYFLWTSSYGITVQEIPL